MWNEYTDPEITETDLVEDIDDTILEDIPKKRTRRKKDEKTDTENYVHKDEMWDDLITYYTALGDKYDWDKQELVQKYDWDNLDMISSASFPEIPQRLTITIDAIATNMGHRGNFCTYSWKDEMKGDSCWKMVKAVRDCLFKCYTVAEICTRGTDDNGPYVTYYNKKGELQKRAVEASDEFFNEDGVEFIKFKANPFGYFSRITTNCYLNRIKMEKRMEETKREFQSETWEKLYANEEFRNVRRQKILDSDENDVMFDE